MTTTISTNLSTSTNTLDDILEGIKLHGIDYLDLCKTDADLDQYKKRINEEFLNYPIPKEVIDHKNWYVPTEYMSMDIEKHILNLCKTDEEVQRVKSEIQLYQKHDFLDVLRCMKYIVDTLRENNVVWGVGRGSSVASYVLYLLGVHKVDSIKYNLPLDEFFKGEING